MGSGITQTLAAAGFPVCVFDTSDAVRGTVKDRIENGRFGLRSAVDRGKLGPDEVDAVLGRITVSSDLSQAFANADLVIEAVPEDLGLKIDVFRALESVTPESTVLAS